VLFRSEVETALERELSGSLMGGKPRLRKVKEGSALVEQGAEGDELFLLLDGVLRVEVDGERLAEIGPGALLGERAVLEGGRRTATLRAVTPCKVAVAAADSLGRDALHEVSRGHRREDR
jgi:CRP-like cAMP-binding protein